MDNEQQTLLRLEYIAETGRQLDDVFSYVLWLEKRIPEKKEGMSISLAIHTAQLLHESEILSDDRQNAIAKLIETAELMLTLSRSNDTKPPQ